MTRPWLLDSILRAKLTKLPPQVAVVVPPFVPAVAFFDVGTGDTGTTSLSVPFPSSIAAGDGLLLQIGNKYPPNAPTTPAGWSLISQPSGGAGAAGNDSGTVYNSVYWREADGTEAGSVAITLTGANSGAGQIYQYTKGSGSWDVAVTTGSDNAGGVGWSTTGASDPGFQDDDVLLYLMTANTDITGYINHLMAIPGCVVSAFTGRGSTPWVTGNDGRIVGLEFTMTGTSSGVPVFTMDNPTPTANSPAGAAVFVRLREVP